MIRIIQNKRSQEADTLVWIVATLIILVIMILWVAFVAFNYAKKGGLVETSEVMNEFHGILMKDITAFFKLPSGNKQMYDVVSAWMKDGKSKDADTIKNVLGLWVKAYNFPCQILEMNPTPSTGIRGAILISTTPTTGSSTSHQQYFLEKGIEFRFIDEPNSEKRIRFYEGSCNI